MLLVGLVALGVCGFVFGLIGDLNRWWAELGYTSNVLAGATGACFGIPFAVLVLQRLLRDDLTRAEHTRLARRVRKFLLEITASLHYILHSEDVAASRNWHRLRETFSAIERLGSSNESNDGDDTRVVAQLCLESLSVENCRLRGDLGRFFFAGRYEPDDVPIGSWLTISDHWRALADELLPAAQEELDLCVDPLAVQDMNLYVQRVTGYHAYHPLKDFSALADFVEAHLQPCLASFASGNRMPSRGERERICELGRAATNMLRTADIELRDFQKFVKSLEQLLNDPAFSLRT